jgi:hypothetical protein
VQKASELADFPAMFCQSGKEKGNPHQSNELHQAIEKFCLPRPRKSLKHHKQDVPEWHQDGPQTSLFYPMKPGNYSHRQNKKNGELNKRTGQVINYQNNGR